MYPKMSNALSLVHKFILDQFLIHFLSYIKFRKKSIFQFLKKFQNFENFFISIFSQISKNFICTQSCLENDSGYILTWEIVRFDLEVPYYKFWLLGSKSGKRCTHSGGQNAVSRLQIVFFMVFDALWKFLVSWSGSVSSTFLISMRNICACTQRCQMHFLRCMNLS